MTTRSRAVVDLTNGCGCKKARHEHGQYATYNVHLCDCLLCKAANRERRNRRYREKLYGRFRLVDAQPVRDHVIALQAQGMGWKRVAAVAGVSISTVSALLYGRGNRSGEQPRPPRRQIDRALAAKILAVELDLAPSAYVDGTGSLRRLRALRAIGWTRAALAARLGRASGNLDLVGRYAQVTASYAQAVKTLYDELWDQPQHGPAADRARARALDLGWAPPMAWDDDTIDDPAAVPHGVRRRRRSAA